VSGYVPDGYMSVTDAVAEAARYWFGDRIAAIETAKPGTRASKDDEPDNSIEAAVRAFSQASLPDALRHEFEDIARQTAHRLRNLLHKGKLKAYYFVLDGAHSVSREFWATAQADGVLESGTYWPFGEPTRLYESRPNYLLFLPQSELDALLSEQPAQKRPLPNAKNPELVAALRKLEDLPNRAAQFQALCNMPEFREFAITNALFREAAKKAGPRRAGRKPQR
jgi:hypothetical protein